MLKRIILLFIILFAFSSCSNQTSQTLQDDAVETPLASVLKEPTTPDISIEPTFIASDLNDDGVEERIVIDTSSESATIQIQQTREGGSLTLADIPFSNSEIGGYYLRRGKNKLLKEWRQG